MNLLRVAFLTIGIVLSSGVPAYAGTNVTQFWESPIEESHILAQVSAGTAATATKYGTAGAKIYKFPVDSAEVLDESVDGTTFEVVKESSGWSMITTCDGVAFMKTAELNDNPPEPEKQWVSLGNFRLTFYCPCRKCATGNGVTASGRKATVGRTVAVSKAIAPLGAKLLINGHEYTVDDRGVTGRTVDIFVSSHQEARRLGVKHAEVFILK